ncbi:MAG: hypothetical protein PHY47_26150 [Lachnospiraceae bacterium]|nr:hypothetical protein [Lachnospiraceae bacterium]
MSKMEKRRIVDFSRKEMKQLSGCNNSNTFDNKLKVICNKYNIPVENFKMDAGEISGGENFFPAECAELVALLIKCQEFNPTKRENSSIENVNAIDVKNYYQKILEKVEKLPEDLKDLVYLLPSHMVAMEVTVWIERMVTSLSMFTTNYMTEQREDVGALLKELNIKMDMANYHVFSNQRMIGLLTGMEEDEPKSIEEVLYSKYSSYEDACRDFMRAIQIENIEDDEELNNEEIIKKINSPNIGIDEGIGYLIKMLSQEIGDIRSELQYENCELSDYTDTQKIQTRREEYYKEVIRPIAEQGQIDKREIFQNYYKGATGWKNFAQRIEQKEFDSKKALIQLYEREISERQMDILNLNQRIEALKSDEGDRTFDFFNKINKKYVERYQQCEGEGNITRKLAEKFVGNTIWEFLNKKQK